MGGKVLHLESGNKATTLQKINERTNRGFVMSIVSVSECKNGQEYQFQLAGEVEPIAELYEYMDGIFASTEEAVSAELVEKMQIIIQTQ